MPGKYKFGTTVVLVFAANVCLLLPMGAHAADVSGCLISNPASQQSWDQDCAAAILAEQDPTKKAELHFRRAYVLNER